MVVDKFASCMMGQLNLKEGILAVSLEYNSPLQRRCVPIHKKGGEKIEEEKKEKSKLKSLLETSEEIAISETENIVEEIRDREVIRDCISEEDVDDKDVVSRVRLF